MGFFESLSRMAAGGGGASLPDLLKRMKKENGTELRIIPGRAPEAVVRGRLLPLSGSSLDVEECRTMCTALFTDAQKAEFEKNKKIEFAFGIKDAGRFKAAVVSADGKVSAVFSAFEPS